MTLKELFTLKEQMLADLDKIKESDFPTPEAYKYLYLGSLDGITNFFFQTMNHILDQDDSSLDSKSKKSA